MDFYEAMQLIETGGFPWNRFGEIFPFGDPYLREGNYEKLVALILKSLKSDAERELLLDLIDTQHSVFSEQISHLRIQSGDSDRKMFEIEEHLLSAQLQINSNLRRDFGLGSKNAGSMLHDLKFPNEHLLDRMFAKLGLSLK